MTGDYYMNHEFKDIKLRAIKFMSIAPLHKISMLLHLKIQWVGEKFSLQENLVDVLVGSGGGGGVSCRIFALLQKMQW